MRPVASIRGSSRMGRESAATIPMPDGGFRFRSGSARLGRFQRLSLSLAARDLSPGESSRLIPRDALDTHAREERTSPLLPGSHVRADLYPIFRSRGTADLRTLVAARHAGSEILTSTTKTSVRLRRPPWPMRVRVIIAL